MFEGEFLSLETIYPTNTVRVPKPIKVSLSSICLPTTYLFILKAVKHLSWKQRWFSLCWKLPDRAQSFVFCAQIVTE